MCEANVEDDSGIHTGDVDKLNKVADETHDKEANSSGSSNLLELYSGRKVILKER
jgi:hypothetical protein